MKRRRDRKHGFHLQINEDMEVSHQRSYVASNVEEIHCKFKLTLRNPMYL